MTRDTNHDMIMEPFFTPSMILLLSGIGFVGIVVLHLLVLLAYKIIRCNRNRRQTTGGYTSAATNENQNNIDLAKLPSNTAYHETGAVLNPKLEKLEYPRNNIIYIKDLGQGAFGRGMSILSKFCFCHEISCDCSEDLTKFHSFSSSIRQYSKRTHRA